MTDNTEAQPEALRLADERAVSIGDDLYEWEHSAEQMIRDQHAEIQQLKAQLSARQAAPNGWRLRIPGRRHTHQWDSARVGDYNSGWNDCQKTVCAALSAAPPPPEREPLTLAQIDGIGDATGKPSFTWHYEFARAIERAHGIGATND